MFKKENIYKLLIWLSLFGIILALYLFYNFLTKPVFESCYVNSLINCDAVTKGSLSTLLGMPVSLIGLTGYIVILISAFFKKRKFILGVSAFGMAFCLYITIQEIFSLKVICPVCLLCQLDMFVIFLFGIILNIDLKNRR